jgi:hypothetical protein
LPESSLLQFTDEFPAGFEFLLPGTLSGSTLKRDNLLIECPKPCRKDAKDPLMLF